MTECGFITGCPFFNDKMEEKSNLASIYKKKYCQGNFDGCARYMVATTVGREKVPSNMFPNMKDRAEEIISVNN